MEISFYQFFGEIFIKHLHINLEIIIVKLLDPVLHFQDQSFKAATLPGRIKSLKNCRLRYISNTI